jgi:hypothetical protein
MDTDLLKKLRRAPGMRALVINSPSGCLGDLGQPVHIAPDDCGPYDFVQLFTRDRAEFERLAPAVFQSVAFDGLFWFTYPKRTGQIASDISRDSIWELVRGTGLRPVTQIAVDETWSALRLRPESKVNK